MDSKKYILYADDDADDREMLEQAFENTPYVLLTFKNGQVLLDYLGQVKKEAVSLIVLDINMPMVDGIVTLRALRADDTLRDLPIILFTTSGSPMDRTSAEELGARVIVKPVTYDQLKQVSHTMLSYCADYERK
jgi:CheY-like chemotaxis protein